MAYIGKSPSQGVRSRFQYQATAGQDSFSSTDANGLTLTYTDSLYMDVYQNGILLVPGDDYTATTGTTVVLVQSASLNDIIEMVVYDVFSVPDAVSQSAGGIFSGNVTMGGTLRIVGTTTAPSSPSAGDIWFNSATSIVSGIAPNAMAVYNGTSWSQMSNKFSGTGGTETTYTSGGINYKVHTFLSSSTFTVNSLGPFDSLIIAGGGGGGASGGSGWQGGHGGAGGYLAFSNSSLGLSLGSNTVTVGAGGASANNGTNSVLGNQTAIGGGHGGQGDYPGAGQAGAAGGSGGGGGQGYNSPGPGAGGAGTSGQGFAGAAATSAPYVPGGGGGSGGTPSTGGAGGPGTSNSIRAGSAVTYAEGGGSSSGAGGDNTGTGGQNLTAGGSGIVIIRYAI